MKKNFLCVSLAILSIFIPKIHAGGTFAQRAANQTRKMSRAQTPQKRAYHREKVARYTSLARRPSIEDVALDYELLAHQQTRIPKPATLPYVPDAAHHSWFPPRQAAQEYPSFQELSPEEADVQARRVRRKKWAQGIGGGLALGGLLAGTGIAIDKIVTLEDKKKTQAKELAQTKSKINELSLNDPARYQHATTVISEKVAILNKTAAETLTTMNGLQTAAQNSADDARKSAATAATSAETAATNGRITPPTAASITQVNASAKTAADEATAATQDATAAQKSLADLTALATGITAKANDASSTAQKTIDEIAPLITKLTTLSDDAKRAHKTATDAQQTIQTSLTTMQRYVSSTKAAATSAQESANLAAKHAQNASDMALGKPKTYPNL